MVCSRVLGSLASLVGLVAGNFQSPGLGKCLDIRLDLKENGERETVQELASKTEPVNLQLYPCHGEDNQHYLIEDGHFKCHALPSFCLEADEVKDGGNVHLVKCDEGKAEQKWVFTGHGNVKLAGTEKCLDVLAELKENGQREVWHEIKARTAVNVQLYKCHDPATTSRVNQLWAWKPWKDGAFVSEKFILQDLGLHTGEPKRLAVAALGTVLLLAGGIVISGWRTRRASSMTVFLEPAE